MKKNLYLIIILLFLSQIIFSQQKLKINADYKNMQLHPMGMEKYTFKSSTEVHNLQEGGDFTLQKGNYKFDKDEFGQFVTFTYKYYNYGFEKDSVYETPEIAKYYFINDKNIFLLYTKENPCDGYSNDETIFLFGDYSASSKLIEFKDKPNLYNPVKLSNEYDLTEFWAEGEKGDGTGEKIKVDFTVPPFDSGRPAPANVELYGIIIFNGVFKSNDLYKNNSRVKNITLTFSNGKTKKITLKDTIHPQIIYFDKSEDNISFVELKIDSIYKGLKWDDTCITKLIYFGKYKDYKY